MMDSTATILMIDDDEDVLLAARLLLQQHYRSVRTESNPSRLAALIRQDAPDVILLDMNFSQGRSSGDEGFHWLNFIREHDPDAVVILITAYGDVELAVRAIKQGATDFVLKPWQNEKLLATVSSAVALRRSRREVEQLRTRQGALSEELSQPFRDIIGRSETMRKVLEMARKVARTDANILLLGENGTGKELVARAIHRESERASDVFISVDMGAISETLFQSELFGYVRGAFTDARQDRAGRFELASGGTLFLDEIGNLPLPLQARLLTVLQNREVTRLGSNKVVPIDIRLVCATNMPLYEMVAARSFRQDLLYRINTVEIRIPPLRERPDDIALLVEHFLDVYSRKYKKTPKRLSPATMVELQQYTWPGNVRELQHAVERAVILSEGETLDPSDFFLAPGTADLPDTTPLDTYNLDELEKGAIRAALTKHNGNISLAAEELGLTRTSLYRRLKKYNL